MKRYACVLPNVDEAIGHVYVSDGVKPTAEDLAYMKRFLVGIQKRDTLSDVLNRRDKETRKRGRHDN